MTKDGVTVNLVNGEFPAKKEKAILMLVAERLLANKCPEKSSVEFHFERIISKRALQGVYPGKKTT